MESSRFINLLRLLSPSQFRRFESFVNSPYHNQSEKLIRLIQHLSKAAPSFRGPLVEKEIVFKAVFGKAADYDPQKVFNQVSRLRQLWEKFVIAENLAQDKRAQAVQLLNGLDKWELNDAVAKNFDRLWEHHNRQEIRDNAYYFHSHQLLPFGASGSANNRRGMSAGLGQQMETLDLMYLTTKLKYSCEWLSRNFITNLSGEDHLIESIINELSNPLHPYRQLPAVSIYYQILQSFIEPENEAHFHYLLKLITDHADQFEKKELGDMYNYAQNYCVRKINEGKSEFFEEVFEIYKRQLEEESLMSSGYLPHEHYKNITTVGLRLGRYKWVKAFLEQYQNQLHPDNRENAYTYNLSIYYYEQAQFPEAMKLLQKVIFTDVYYDLSARSTLLKIYYETDDMDSLRYHLEAFRAFLNRNKSISKVKLVQHQNLIRFSKKLMRLRKSRGVANWEGYKSRCLSLKQEMETTKAVQASWLRKQCDKLLIPPFYASEIGQ